MRAIFTILFVGLTLFLTPGGSPNAAGEAMSEPRLQAFHWLEGTWRRETRRGVAFETWKVLGPRTLEGRGYRVLPPAEPGGQEREADSEALLLVEMMGELFYIPRPGENPLPVAFKLVEMEADRAVFENRAHDFPQRIIYERADDGRRLIVTVEGPDQGADTQKIVFPFERAD